MPPVLSIYEDSTHGFVLSYPEGWAEVPGWSRGAIFALGSPDLTVNIEIYAEYKTEPVVLADYVEWIKEQSAPYELEVISEEYVTLEDGTSAHKMVATEKIMGALYKMKSVTAARETQAVMVYAMAVPADFDANLEDIDWILSSFHLIPLEVMPTPTPTVVSTGFYRDEEHGFSISYPQGWREMPPSEWHIFQVAPPEHIPSVSIMLQSVEKATTPAEAAAQCMKGMSEVYTEFEFVSEGGITLDDGTPAYEVVYTGSSPRAAEWVLKCKSVFVVRGTECFWLQSYTTPPDMYDEHVAVMDEVLYSFHLE